jgi:acyl-homoserine lactone acylase PvdQ
MSDSLRRRGARIFASLAATLLLTAAWAVAHAQDTGMYLSILPPGNSGHLDAGDALDFLNNGILPPHVDDQREMYANLVYAQPGLTDGELLDYFKAAPLGEPQVVTSKVTNLDGITIERDEFGVPYIKGRSRRKLMYGIGYASAQDRLFAMDLARRAGRGHVSELIGGDPFALENDEALYQFAGYDDADLEAAFDTLVKEFRGRGRRVKRDIEAFVDGINAFITLANAQPLGAAPAEYLGLDQLPIEKFKPIDILAIATQLEQLFGAGGGGEHRNSLLLQKLEAAYGTTDGEALYRDLRSREEAEAPVTTDLSFPYLVPQPIDPAAVAMIDVGSLVQPPITEVIGPLPPSPLSVDTSFLARKKPHPSMSNFVAVTAAHGAGGHPIAVMGPQAGYLVPELLYEMNIEGAGIKARGVAITGTPYIVLGRGRNYAWSATAGGSDNTDVRAEKLCEPGGGTPSIMSDHYLFNGECVPIFERIDTWCAGGKTFCASNGDNLQATVERSVHGIIFARATVGGAPVALAHQRASFMREGQNAAAFAIINRKTRRPKAFERAIRFAPGSFNWIYVNQDDLFYYHSGRFPVRAHGVDYEMPSWGTGEWEWQGVVAKDDHPHELNPARGYMTSWNNKPARDWRAADSNYSFGTVHRVDSLEERVGAAVAGGSPISIAEMVEIMEDAGTVDLRGSQVLPLALQIIGSEPSLAAELAVLDQWISDGAMRRDRDHDGEYDDSSAVTIMDAWFEPMIDAAFGAQLGPFYGDIPLQFDDEPGPLGSAYQSGYYGLLDKAFRQVLGIPVTDPLEVLHCADGTLGGCRAAMVASLSDAVADLTGQFGSSDPADWRADPTADQIEFMPFGVASVDPMPWVNRPTFQQVVQVERKR